MSAFFSAAAAVDPSLVDRHHHNVEKSFCDFVSRPAPETKNTVEARSSAFSQKLRESFRICTTEDRRATSHLNNEHARIKGIHLPNNTREPITLSSARVPHVIDVLHDRIRSEIMRDLEEDMQRSILAQQEL